MEVPTGRAEFESLKSEAARLKENNERLEKQNKQMEKEIQQLKVEGAQAQARNVPAKKVASLHLYLKLFSEPMGPVVLRSSADAIQKNDPSSIAFLIDSQGYCVATTGAAAQTRGISAKQLMELSTKLAGGSGGGRESMAQGRIEKLDSFSAIEKQFEQYVQERVK